MKWYKATKNKTQLAVFDFDDTLIQTAKKPQKGQPRHGWNGKDWWGSEESLSYPFFYLRGNTIHKPVVKALTNAVQNNRKVLPILLTGRRGVVAHKVREQLRSIRLYGERVIPKSNKKAKKSFDSKLKSGKELLCPGYKTHKQFFCGDFITEEDYPKNRKGKPQHGTIYHKTYIIKKLMHERIEKLEIWDDRDDHIRQFIALGLNLRRQYENLESVVINRVFPIRDADDSENCTIINIPVKQGMSY